MRELAISKKTFIAFILAILLVNISYSQEHHCGIEDFSTDEMRRYREFVERWKNHTKRNDDTICIPIHPIIVRNDDGSVFAISLRNINQSLANLNNHFTGVGLEFYFVEPTFLDNDNLFDMNGSEILSVRQNDTNINAINILYTQFQNGGNASTAPYPGDWENVTNRLIVMSQVGMSQFNHAFGNNSNQIVVHEMGHFFSLIHTSHGTVVGNDGANAERVVRPPGADANCETSSDLICDTEANPGFGSSEYCLANLSFTYSGDLVDDLGENYIPQLDNIMSDYFTRCRNRLTDGQLERIFMGYLERINTFDYEYNMPPMDVENPTNLELTEVVDGIRLNWTDTSDNEFGYLIERSEISGEEGFLAIINGGTESNVTTFLDRDVFPNTSYWYRIKATNDNCNDYSEIAEITSGLIYCTTNADGHSCEDYHIESFEMNNIEGETIINSIVQNECEGSVSYSLNESYVIASCQTYEFSLSTHYNTEISNQYPILGQRVKIWIDWNQDGFFEVSEIVFDSGIYSQFTDNIQGEFLIPDESEIETYRMRIRSVLLLNSSVGIFPDDFDACDYARYSESEDYALSLKESPCPTNIEPVISHNTSPSQCVHQFSPTLNLPNCFSEVESKWVIYYPDLNSEVISENNLASPISINFFDLGWYKVCLYITIEGPNGELCDYDNCVYWFNDKPCKEQFNNEFEEPNIYPNLVKERLNIIMGKEMVGKETIEIFNHYGDIVDKIKIETKNSAIDISNYLPGQYFLKIKQGNKLFHYKIIKITD